MVVSKLDDSINYPEVKSVDTADIGFDANLYEIEIMPGIKGIIALGNVKYGFSEKNILYIPVYLIEDDEITVQIGVYEFGSSQYPNLLDEDNDFDISKLSNSIPLFYSFTNKEFLLKNGASEGSLEDEGDIDTGDKEDFAPPVEETKPEDNTSLENLSSTLKELLKNFREEDTDVLDDVDPTMNLDMAERRKFKKLATTTWIQNFMKNKLYSIVDNEGGGDCLFATIRDGFKSLDKNISIKDLRGIVSEKATTKNFSDFREQYTMYKNAIIETRGTMKKLAEEVDALKVEKRTEKDRNKQRAIVDIAKVKIADFKRAQREKKHAETLFSDFKWLEGIDNMEKFRSKIRTCKFWADAWAINLLEVALNIKLIILSSENYKETDLGNVLLCDRGFVDESIEKTGIFNPKYYFILDYTGNHYKLITYSEKQIFTFGDIPYSIKMLVIEKCMEKNAGIYNFIPKFKKLKEQLIGDKPEEKNKMEEVNTNPELFDPTTVFQFYSKSSDKPMPGKGAGESIKPENVSKFSELAGIKGWRKVLSNFFIAPFDLDGHKWNSVEHYYHASKFKKNNPEFSLQFSDDSGSQLSKDPILSKSYGGKTGKYKGKLVRPKNIKVDPDFFGPGGRGKKEMEDAHMAKYTQNEESRKVLLLTKDAKLLHYSRGSPPIVFENTMRVRNKIKLDPKLSIIN